MKKILITVLTLAPLAAFGQCISNAIVNLDSPQQGTLCPNGTIKTKVPSHDALYSTAIFSGTTAAAKGIITVTPAAQVNLKQPPNGPAQIDLHGTTATKKFTWIYFTGPYPYGLIYKNTSKHVVNFRLGRWWYYTGVAVANHK